MIAPGEGTLTRTIPQQRNQESTSSSSPIIRTVMSTPFRAATRDTTRVFGLRLAVKSKDCAHRRSIRLSSTGKLTNLQSHLCVLKSLNTIGIEASLNYSRPLQSHLRAFNLHLQHLLFQLRYDGRKFICPVILFERI